MCQLTDINDFFMEAILKPPKLCISGIRRSRRFFIHAIIQPHHCLGYIVINYYQIITFVKVCHPICIHCEMIAIAVSVGLYFEFDKPGALGESQAFRELLYNSENLEAEIYYFHNFTAPLPQPKTSIIPNSKLIHCPYGTLWSLWSGHNVEYWHL